MDNNTPKLEEKGITLFDRKISICSGCINPNGTYFPPTDVNGILFLDEISGILEQVCSILNLTFQKFAECHEWKIFQNEISLLNTAEILTQEANRILLQSTPKGETV